MARIRCPASVAREEFSEDGAGWASGIQARRNCDFVDLFRPPPGSDVRCLACFFTRRPLDCGPFLSIRRLSVSAGFVLAIDSVRATKRVASFSRTSSGRSCHASGGNRSRELPPSLARAPDAATAGARVSAPRAFGNHNALSHFWGDAPRPRLHVVACRIGRSIMDPFGTAAATPRRPAVALLVATAIAPPVPPEAPC